jgi:hypothetical protein
MNQRKMTDIPVQVYNLGSPAGTQMDFGRDELWSRMDAEMGFEAVSLPVFLVNPHQMDLIYPSEYCRALDPEIVRELLLSMQEEDDLLDILVRREEDQRGWSKYSEMVTVGLYLKLGGWSRQRREAVLEKGDTSVRTAEAENAFLNHRAPAVFLCCERIVDWANRLGISHHLVMDEVYYHELGHAIMDTLPDGAPNPYLEVWGRIVEESLANAIAYRCFAGKEARQVQRIMREQPAEYLPYLAVGRLLVAVDWLGGLGLSEHHLKALLHFPQYDVMNLVAWKAFKKHRRTADQYVEDIWKDFAKHLLIEGVS